MTAPCSFFAKIRQYACSQTRFHQYQKNLVGFTVRTDQQLVQPSQASSRLKRSLTSFCMMQRQDTLPLAPVKAEQIERDKLLHAAALSMSAENSNEAAIEKVIYGCRFMTFLSIIGSLMGSVICFLKGCVYVFNSFVHFQCGGKVITMVFEAIDIYLIGTVMLVFGMGLYELFICNLDIAKTSSYGSNLFGLFPLQARPKWLEIKSVNELKTKLGRVIVMLLLIGLFENSKKVAIETTADLLCFAASIFLSSSCLFLLSKLNSTGCKEETNNAS